MNMNRHVFKMIVMFIIAVLVFSTVTMLLWNALMPAIFGLTAISIFQAAVLLILGRVLFGSGFRPSAGHMKHHARLHNMTPEEKREFIRDRHLFFCGGRDRRPGESRESREPREAREQKESGDSE